MKFARTSGQMVSVLNLFLAVFVVFMIGLVAFELSRYLLARDELKTNVEVAALSCQTTLVSSGDPTNATNQASAQASGLQLFKQNSILGQIMSGATLASDPANLNPAPGQAEINFQFLDPITKQPLNQSGAGVGSGVTNPSSAGTLIQAIGAYSYTPAFGQFIGLGNAQFTFQVSALSGVPKIDLMVLLDICGGMDNDTSISTYQRYQTPTGTNWMVNPNPVGGGKAQGLAYTIMCGNTGNPPDMNFTYPFTYENIANSNCITVKYSEAPANGGSNHLAGAGPGTPPGNICTGVVSFIPDSPDFAPQTPSTNKYRQSIAVLNGPLIKAVRGEQYFEKRLEELIAAKPSRIAPNARVKEKHLIAANSDQNLLKLCTEISGSANVKRAPAEKIAQKVNASQLDDKLNTISFAPQFYALPTISGVMTTSSSTGVNPTTPTDDYVAGNGQGYYAASREPGIGADQGPAVMPSIDGYCPNPPTVYGTNAPTIFTGVFVNGVIGTTSADGTMSFNTAAAAIEASLGDLESQGNADKAGVDVSAGGLNLNPQAGWFAFYYAAARQNLEPMMAMVYSLIGFINELAIVSDVHYGFVAFNDSVGTDANSVSAPVNHVSQFFPYPTMNPDGSKSVASTYPLPNIQLSPVTSNQAAIINVLPTLNVWSTRNVSLALQTAYDELQNNGRPGANQAIVLVVSGIPNGADTAASAIQKATTIGAAGIPVYVVCVSIQPSDDGDNDNAYMDTGGANGGVAAASGHGAKYYRVDFSDPSTTNSQLVSVFGNIARRLVSIVRSN